MAKIKFGMMMTDARGKLGGQVFSKNRAGAYIRTKVTPTNPRSMAQTTVRASFAVFTQGWSALTLALIASWNSAVSSWSTTDVFGDLKNPTGKNLYLRLNQSATLAGYPSFDTVPEKLEMVSGIVTEVLPIISLGIIELTDVYAGSGARVVVFATEPVSNGTSYVKNKLRQIYSEVGDVYSPTDAFSAYENRFGTIVLGQNIFFGIKYTLPNGQSSPVQIVKGNITS